MDPDYLNLRLAAKTGADAVRELHAGIGRTQPVTDSSSLLRDLLARHAQGGSCLNRVVALPHARTAAVNRCVLAIGRSETGVDFDKQHHDIRLVVLTGVPIDAVTEYLKWTAHLVRTLRQEEIRRALFAAQTEAAFREIWRRHLTPLIA